MKFTLVLMLSILILTGACKNRSNTLMQAGQGTEEAGDNSDSIPMAGTKPLTEIFDQSQRGVLDILLVIDNSGSMRTIIAKVMENLPDLLKHVEDSNWQIAATGT